MSTLAKSKSIGIKNENADLQKMGIIAGVEYWNLTPSELTEHTIIKGMGVLNDTGALVIDTGEFTGRSPLDKFTVKDSITENTVDWTNSKVNIPMNSDTFDKLYTKVVQYLQEKEIYIRDVYGCADERYRTNVRVITEFPWSNMFADNMFLRPTTTELKNINPEWHVICAPGFKADAAIDGTRQHNFAALDFTRKTIIIGGTGYTGEIKKGIFTVLNFTLPVNENVLPMHCSANIGESGDTAVFFGLSGTGKTTLSADPNRQLIGDDEHGWTDSGVFNFEGGCYAKCVNLSAENEPDIYNAIKHGSILENTKFFENTRTVDYTNISRTENTRVSYPIHFINNIRVPSIGGIPKNIFFLTYDAFGVLPPIARLNKGQAMYQFLSGYTSKVAGTEAGVTEPTTVFSNCYGAPFLPLHPTKYAEMLGHKIDEFKPNVWLINTGMTGGAYGTGKRMSLKYTRALITAALNGDLNNVSYESMPIFGFEFPNACLNVPSEILNPRNTWADKNAYDIKAKDLANAFNKNFEKFVAVANDELKAAAPNY